MDGGRLRRPHLLGIYFMSKMHTKTIQKIQKAYIKTYEKDVKIYKDIENSQGQGAFFFENTGKTFRGSISPSRRSPPLTSSPPRWVMSKARVRLTKQLNG